MLVPLIGEIEREYKKKQRRAYLNAGCRGQTKSQKNGAHGKPTLLSARNKVDEDAEHEKDDAKDEQSAAKAENIASRWWPQKLVRCHRRDE